MTSGRQPLRIAAVQCRSWAADLARSIADHVAGISEAAAGGARVVLFPELSLTGYEPDHIELNQISIGPEDPRLARIAQACVAGGVHALIGAPVAGTDHDFKSEPASPVVAHRSVGGTAERSVARTPPAIGVLHVDPGGGIDIIYRKRRLLIGEVGLFSPGRSAGMLVVAGWKLALAVSGEAGVSSQRESAASSGADAYLVGALYLIGSGDRISEEMKAVTGLGMWAVMAQFFGGTGGGPACGGSGVWHPDGTQLVRLGTKREVAFVDLID